MAANIAKARPEDCKKGAPDMCYWVAQKYVQYGGTLEANKVAIKAAELACAEAHSEACYLLARVYGEEPDRSIYEGEERGERYKAFFRKSCDLGFEPACEELPPGDRNP